MLTKNLYQQVGLVNGIRGEVVELVYADDAPPPKLPLYVVVMFRGNSGGEWSSQERYRGCVPISPVDSTWQDGDRQPWKLVDDEGYVAGGGEFLIRAKREPNHPTWCSRSS